MNIMRLKYGFMMLLFALTAVACSDDNDDEGGFNRKNDERFTRRKVSRIYASSGHEEGFDVKFEYNEQGEIAKITHSWEDEEDVETTIYEFTFTEDEVCMTDTYTYSGGGSGHSFTMVRPLNEQRYVARCTTGVHTYDEDGYLLTTGRDTLVWEAGNLIGRNNKSYITQDKYKYTEVINKANVDFAMAMYYAYYRPDWYDDYLDALGYYGKTNRNLLERTLDCTYTYKYDDKGYVIQFTEKPTSANTIFKESTTYKVEYCD